ncbi:MAG: amidohydrolase family protein [Marmoricola sp.]|nr:amidohydrolase family protein [Marmoricola sp.]
MSLLLRDVEVDGHHVDVRIDDGHVAEIGTLHDADQIIDGRGGALLPGLHDHHLHLFALAAARASIDVGSGLEALRGAAGTWLRAVNARESVDRHVLDGLVPDRPVRVQHRSGGLWMLNSAALERVAGILDDSPDVERDAAGEPTGRLWRYDARLRPALPASSADLGGVVDELHGYGLTSVTDATPDLDPDAVSALRALPLEVTLLGDPTGSAARKLLLRDHDLPTYDELVTSIADIHARGRPVAVHCVTRESLLLTLAVLDEVGRLPGDRIEHAAVVPDPTMLRGLTVVTQPAFVTTRGDDYARDVSPHDLPHLYPYASLLDAGVDVLASSDAPYGPLDPWEVIRAARDRDLGPDERVSAAVSLAGYLTDSDGRARKVEVGTPARFCLLHVPLAEALRNPDAGLVRQVVASGAVPGS